MRAIYEFLWKRISDKRDSTSERYTLVLPFSLLALAVFVDGLLPHHQEDFCPYIIVGLLKFGRKLEQESDNSEF